MSPRKIWPTMWTIFAHRAHKLWSVSYRPIIIASEIKVGEENKMTHSLFFMWFY
jgi:hypothetical protein